jgi:pectate lyase
MITTLMRTLTLGVLATIGLSFIPDRASGAVTLPYHDAFNYSEGNLIAVSGGTWVLGNGSSSFEIAVSNAAALTAPDGFPAASGKGVRRAPSGSSRRAVLQYTSVPASDGNTMYVSFLLNVQTAPGSAQLLGFLDNNASSQTSPQAGIFLDGGSKIGIGKKSSGPGFTMANGLSAGTHLVVVRYTFQSGNDRVDLWVDPASTNYGAATAPASLGSVTGSSDPPSLDYFQFYTTGTSGGAQFIDELYVGTTWADVVPSGGAVLGSKLGFTTQPADTLVNATMSPVVVQVQSAGGSAVASNGVPITLTLTGGSGTLSGTTTRNTDATGKATFDDLSINTAGTGKQLTAAASGIGAGLTSAVSSNFAITETPPVSGLVVTDSRMRPEGFVMDGHNDEAGVFCQVMGAININAASNDWIIVQYQNFDSNGRITFTNPVSPAMPQAFYRLRTGDTTTKTVPPSIGIPPVSQIVSPGTTATFAVTAVGPLLQYLWYFNGNPIYGSTNATLVIPNAGPANAGNYSVAVANPAGNITSATVTLGVGNIAPVITAQPQDETVTAGGTAIFSVSATGTTPLTYQWYYNTGTPLSGKTNAQLTLTGVSTNDAGAYSVRVVNTYGNVTSSNATLTVNAVPTGLPDTNMVGFAAATGVTGGAGGTEVTASDYTSLRAYCRQAGRLIIHVQGQITPNESYCYVDAPNKTIVGDGTNAAILGDLRLNTTNVIVQNLYFNNPANDGITVDGSSSHGTGMYIWVDHCTFYNCGDGSLDVTKGADYVTVSWCKFYYAPVAPGVVNHEFVNLIASSDSDNLSQYHVTFHHNWYSDYCRERMPSVRFGRVHCFNNYYSCAGNNYCVRTRINAQVLVENNYYLGVQNPWERYVTSGSPGLLHASGNITNNCIWNPTWYSGVVLIPGDDTLTDPSLTTGIYPYTLDDAADVPYYVSTYAGSGKYPYVTP